MTKIKAAILDWAGTTVDFGSVAPVVAFVEAFKSLDVEITVAEARTPMGRAKREHIEAVCNLPSVLEKWQAKFGRSPTDDDVEQIYQTFLPLQFGCIEQHSDVISGIPETIEQLRRQGIKIGSSTGYTRELMEQLMPKAAEQGYAPDAMQCASDVKHGRPAPWMCFENMRLLDVHDVSTCIKVDDSLVGITAGNNAGMITVGITKSGNLVGHNQAAFDALDEATQKELIENAEKQMREVGADFVIESLVDLPGVIETLQD